MNMDARLQAAIQQLQADGLEVPPNAREALARSLAKYSGQVSDAVLREMLEKILDGIKSLAHPDQTDRGNGQTVTEGDTETSLRGKILNFLGQFSGAEKIAGSLNLAFKLGTAADVVQGAGRFLTAQTDVDEYPAWELSRFYDRAIPRGFKRLGKSLVAVPDDDWPSRWREAAADCGDDDALSVLKNTGRMVALKSSPIWETLGNLRDDSLGNSYPPFAFNSGYDVDGVPRNECIKLGLLAADETPQPAKINWLNLFPDLA